MMYSKLYLLAGMPMCHVLLISVPVQAQVASFARTVSKNPQCGLLGFVGNETLAVYETRAEGRQVARFWNVKTGRTERTFILPPLKSDEEGILRAVTPSGRFLLRKLRNGAEIFDAQTGRRVFRRQFELLCNDAILSADGKTLVLGAGAPNKTRVEIWDVSRNKLRHNLQTGNEVALSDGGRLLVTNGGDTGVAVWSMATGKLQRRFTGLPAIVSNITLSPDITTVALWGSEETGSTLHLWSTQTGAAVAPLVKSAQQRALAFSPDNQTLLAAGRLWNWKTRQSKQLLGDISEAHFSPDGKMLAVNNRNGLVLYKIKTTARRPVPQKQSPMPKGLAFNSGGNG
jgi:WD40 repeat protein